MRKIFTKQVINKLQAIFIIPFVLAILLVPFSKWIGWNLMTLILFWFLLAPILSAYLPKKILKTTNPLRESLIGLSVFYAVMVLMIYDQFQTDYFKLMMISWVVNSGVVTLITLSLKPAVKHIEA